MLFRELTMADEGDIFAAVRAAFAAPPWNEAWERADFRRYLQDILGNENSLGFGLFEGEQLAALALGRLKHWPRGVEYDIDDFCVHPAWQGRGVGSALLERIWECARARGFCEVALLTRRDAPAHGFYQKNGFADVEWRAWMMRPCQEDM